MTTVSDVAPDRVAAGRVGRAVDDCDERVTPAAGAGRVRDARPAGGPTDADAAPPPFTHADPRPTGAGRTARQATSSASEAVQQSTWLRPAMLRGSLVVCCVAAALAAMTSGAPSARVAADPELASLLRGMAAIKTLLAIAAFALVTWRFRYPIGPRAASICIAGTAAMTGGSAAIWALSAIVPAAVAFHAGMVALALVGWRDDALVRPLDRTAPHARGASDRPGADRSGRHRV